MEEKNYSGIIPPQHDGSKINVESSVDMINEEEAKLLFQTAKSRLLDVNNWQHLAGKFLAAFQLTDSHGKVLDGPVQEGLLFKIDIPGPGSETGKGFDYVRVEKVEQYYSENIESIAIRVRPAPNPSSDNEDIAHFYSGEATSTFTVTRENTKITAAIYDRNTKTNEETSKLVDKLRNAVVGAGGIISFSRIQWKSLVEGLLEK